MYIAAALCMWLLRAWKVGQLERVALVEGKSAADIEVMTLELNRQPIHSKVLNSGLFKHLLAPRNV